MESDLRSDIAELKSDVSELKRDVAELKGDVAELKGDVRVINQRLDTMQKDLDGKFNLLFKLIMGLYGGIGLLFISVAVLVIDRFLS